MGSIRGGVKEKDFFFKNFFLLFSPYLLFKFITLHSLVLAACFVFVSARLMVSLCSIFVRLCLLFASGVSAIQTISSEAQGQVISMSAYVN